MSELEPRLRIRLDSRMVIKFNVTIDVKAQELHGHKPPRFQALLVAVDTACSATLNPEALA